MSDVPVVEFFRLISTGRAPKRAERSAGGTLPSRAMRFCDAVTSAIGFGYWIFPPMTFQLLWDGHDVFWSDGGSDEWMPISGTVSGAVQFPDFETAFAERAPSYLAEYSPPFISALAEPGVVQIWTGLITKTRPGWSLNVRAPVNLPASPNLVAMEGIVETDLWFGPLFTNFRITKTDAPVLLRAEVPFLHVQPIPQVAYSETTLGSWRCGGPSEISDADWRRLANVLLPNPDPEARKGDYAVAVRKRRLCPIDVVSLEPGA